MTCLSGSMRSCRMRNQNASRLTSVKHNVLTVFHATQAGLNVIAGTARSWVVGQYLATAFKIVEITDGLAFAPCTQSVGADIHEVGLGKAG